ncbi:MAG: GNAT family N-acetyltransferase [Candidatus Rokubacteria bacterium]|nr:GNAT family N-acetyltransferase [Candidatus Rokubacteria bacterium]
MKVESLDRFDLLDEGTWNGLLARMAAPVLFLTRQWQEHWWRAFAGGRRLRLYTVTDSTGQLMGLLPLYAESNGTVRIVGGVDVSDYLDLVAPAGGEEEVWAALLQHRSCEADVWDLHCLRASSATVSLVPSLAPQYGLRARVSREERCPVLPLPATWDAYLEGLPGKDRHELRRKLRRLERELPGATVRWHASAEGVDEAMTAFLTLHRKSKPGKARFMDEGMEEFFRAVACALAREGWLRLWFLEHEARPLAAYLTYEYAGGVALYNSGFDPAHAALSPGIVLLSHVIKDAIARGFRRFDFLRGEEPYKYAFGARAEDLFNIVVTP